jgi:copper type II ascorbate-dependent monooxygenase-like protein
MRTGLLLFALLTTASAQVTYTREISRIIQAKCQICHQPNDIAPFALMTYDDAVTYAPDIARAVGERRMPPWKPHPDVNSFREAFGLTPEERQQILDWISNGTLQGDPADLPEPRAAKDSPWDLGDPDLVLAMPLYTPPERTADTYRCFVLPTNLTEDRMLSAVQALPGAKQEVHHVLVFADDTGESEALDGKDGQPGYTCFGGPNLKNLNIGSLLGGWAPGARAHHLPDGIGMRLRRNSRIVMQVHYHPSGRVQEDQTQLGFWFRPVGGEYKRLVNVPIVNDRFVLPPGESSIEVKATQVMLPGQLITVAPHMHLLGRQIKVDLQHLNGTVDPLIYIDDWDFNWQGFYTFTNPVTVAPADVLRVTAVYDNSENNPKNPNNPLIPVRWGEGTNDEMCLAFVGFVIDNQALLALFSSR